MLVGCKGSLFCYGTEKLMGVLIWPKYCIFLLAAYYSKVPRLLVVVIFWLRCDLIFRFVSSYSCDRFYSNRGDLMMALCCFIISNLLSGLFVRYCLLVLVRGNSRFGLKNASRRCV